MENVITITLLDKGSEPVHKIEFDSSPTASELVGAIIVLQQVLEHNFDRQTILNKLSCIYARLENVEEVVRGEDNV